MKRNNVDELFKKVYLEREPESILLSLLEENSIDVDALANQFYFAMNCSQTVYIVPKVYWDEKKSLFPGSMELIDYFLNSVGYEVSPSFYELEHDDYDNKMFMKNTGFIENEFILNDID